MSGDIDMGTLVEALRELPKVPGILGRGDSLFPALKGTWDRLVRDYLARPEDQRELMSAGFKGGALTIFNNIAATNMDADANTLWTLLKAQLFNHALVKTPARSV
ncbi:hypothetical protein NDN08_000488 [Rhodosorus marinus]|uniref:Selenoprotein O n=1 Tax=Rhodosorus marinus TaxID=101924 RepID=A0AAV8US52_9RHOD|nr:hypothetical protein NDN08_000488 [Rhodosorus marinus]